MSPVAAANASRTAPPFPLLCCLSTLIFRCGYFAATRWISSHVLSFEWPSMKIISVPKPISGVRCTAASMLPASLRAGITTEHVNSRRTAASGRGRAVTITDKQNGAKIGASQRFNSVSSSGVFTGHSIRVCCVITSQPASRSRFFMSDAESQFCSIVGALKPSRAATSRIGRHTLLKNVTTSRVRGCATARRCSSTNCTSGKSFTKSDNRM